MLIDRLDPPNPLNPRNPRCSPFRLWGQHRFAMAAPTTKGMAQAVKPASGSARWRARSWNRACLLPYSQA